MLTPNQILEKMDALLNELILTAERLLEISHQIIEKDELENLQVIQEQQVNELIALDDAFHKTAKKNAAAFPLRKRIDKKLDQFEKLNTQFIQNMHEKQSMLNFDNQNDTPPHSEGY